MLYFLSLNVEILGIFSLVREMIKFIVKMNCISCFIVKLVEG